jgi:hypothetical protein
MATGAVVLLGSESKYSIERVGVLAWWTGERVGRDNEDEVEVLVDGKEVPVGVGVAKVVRDRLHNARRPTKVLENSRGMVVSDWIDTFFFLFNWVQFILLNKNFPSASFKRTSTSLLVLILCAL